MYFILIFIKVNILNFVIFQFRFKNAYDEKVTDFNSFLIYLILRIIIYTGKGGTGKTVNSCSTL